MQVTREGFHYCYFRCFGADYCCSLSRCGIVNMNPRRNWRILDIFEMSVYTFRTPECELSFDIFGRTSRLKTKRIAA